VVQPIARQVQLPKTSTDAELRLLTGLLLLVLALALMLMRRSGPTARPA
jgi:LPXTG-motif cell wall-anchored protein